MDKNTGQAPSWLLVTAQDGTVLHRERLDRRDSTRPFSSGKVGYFAGGKAVIRSVAGDSEVRHQFSCSIVEISAKQ